MTPGASDDSLAYPYRPEVRVAWTVAADVGALASAALERPDLAGQALVVSGPESFDGHELAAAFSEVLGRLSGYVFNAADIGITDCVLLALARPLRQASLMVQAKRFGVEVVEMRDWRPGMDLRLSGPLFAPGVGASGPREGWIAKPCLRQVEPGVTAWPLEGRPDC